MSNSQLNKSKSEIKNRTEVTLKTSSNVVGDSNDENIFPHKLLLTNTQISKLCKAFTNGSSANIKLLKTQLHKIGQSGRFLGRLLGPLLKSGLPLIGNVLKLLAKSVSIPLGLTTAASVTDAVIHKEMLGSVTATLIVSNKKMRETMKIIKYLEESGILIKGITKTIKNEEQKGGFISMLLGTLGSSLLGNLLTGKGTIRADEGNVRAGQDF